jgi:Holliday junction DNA helicase RuvA
MIDFVEGKVGTKYPTHVILENNGIGYDLQISVNTFEDLPAEGEKTRLKTYLHVREDSLQLFAFSSEDERKLFRGLISVSGVGPKLAQTILSGIHTSDLLTAIRNGDEQRLTGISGVGKKTAQRLIVELKEKFAMQGFDMEPDKTAHRLPAYSALEEEAMMALMSLGYKKANIEKAIDRVRSQEKVISVEELIKKALQQI